MSFMVIARSAQDFFMCCRLNMHATTKGTYYYFKNYFYGKKKTKRF